MKLDPKPATLITCLLVLSLAVAQGSDHRTKLSQVRSLSLPSSAVLDKHAQPIIASSGKIGFVASVTGGSLISFNLASGRILSSFSVGETVGCISMIEAAGHRFIAVPAANDPTRGSPATVTIIDATSAKRLEPKSLLVLPGDARITPGTGAVLTHDGRFCLIASSLDVPTLYSFDVETGQMISHLALIGRPSEFALFDDGARRLAAIVSADKNNLSLVKIDAEGALGVSANFSPSIARFDDANNPVFNSDGRTVYIAASIGNRLFAVDSDSGIIIDSVPVTSPARISVALRPDGVELIATTRLAQASGEKRGGATVVKNQDARLTVESEFSPPDGIDFSPVNNVAFTNDGSIAFVGSLSGMLFAFNTDTGELESYQNIGGELHRIALSENARSVAVVRSASSGDEVVMVSFDVIGPDESDPSSPTIDSLSPETAEQGRLKNLRLVVVGRNLTEGSSLLINGSEVGAELIGKGRALQTQLPKSLFERAEALSIQVKAANGILSQPKALNVVRPGAPVIESISPAEVPGPSGPFTLRVKGINFRASSAIVVAGQALNTQQVSSTVIQATVPADLAAVIQKDPLKVQVNDLAVSDLVSANDKSLLIFGPRVTELRSSTEAIVAGDRRFILRIRGENFREGARVEINGRTVPANKIIYIARRTIKLIVPGEFFQDVGKLSVVVRSRGGSESVPQELAVSGPEITAFGTTRLLAGTSRARVDIFGRHFRRQARVYVKGTSKALQVPVTQIRFRNTTHITVTLGGELRDFLARPDTLQFEVVNRNGSDGVPSSNRALDIVGPRINDVVLESVAGDESRVRMRIEGANFRRGAFVEFVKNGAAVLRQAPVKLKANSLTTLVAARKLEALGEYQVRVVNPGAVASIPFRSQRVASVAGDDE